MQWCFKLAPRSSLRWRRWIERRATHISAHSTVPSSHLLPTDEGAASQAQLDLIPVVLLRVHNHVLDPADRGPLRQPGHGLVDGLGRDDFGQNVNVKSVAVP